MKAAITSEGCEQLAMNNIGPALDAKFFPDPRFDELWGTPMRPDEGDNPEVLFIKGWFVPDYVALARMYKIMGDQGHKYNDRCKKAEKIVILWAGSDVLGAAHWRQKAGKYEPQIFRDLRTERFMHVPVGIKQKYELEKLLDLRPTDPLPTPARELFERQPLPDKMTVAVYMPTYSMELYRYDMCLAVAKLMPDAQFIFYHWMFPTGPEGLIKEGDVPNVRYQYACSFEQYKEIITESSCSLRITRHEGLSGGVADFLMSGRPVLTCRDMPEWPAGLDNKKIETGEQVAEHIAITLKSFKGEVSEKTRRWYLDNLDPKKYKSRMNELLDKQWPGFSL